MSTVEAISFSAKSNIPVVDSPEALIDGLENKVQPGLSEHFDDVAWIYYFDTAERIKLLNDPSFQALLEKLGDNAQQPRIDESTRPNVLPKFTDSVRRMRELGGRGGGFSRVSLLDSQRFVTVPAHFPQSSNSREIELNLSNGICFDGQSLVTALFSEGFEAEIIDYRAEEPFPAYRERAIGSFFVSHTLEL